MREKPGKTGPAETRFVDTAELGVPDMKKLWIRVS
jgi:hypothetical protein